MFGLAHRTYICQAVLVLYAWGMAHTLKKDQIREVKLHCILILLLNEKRKPCYTFNTC